METFALIGAIAYGIAILLLAMISNNTLNRIEKIEKKVSRLERKDHEQSK